MRYSLLIGNLLLISSCTLHESRVEVVNATGHVISDLTIQYGEQHRSIEALSPNAKYVFQDSVSGEGVARLSFTRNHRPMIVDVCYYSFENPPQGTVIIQDASVDRTCR